MILNKISLILLLLVSVFSNLTVSQNGKIINKEKYYLGEKLNDITTDSAADNFSFLSDVTIEEITYRSDGLKVKGFLVYPNNKKQNYPCIIYNRGGNKEFGAITPKKILFLARMASWGYVVAGSQYRGNAGGEGLEEFGGKDINDILNLIPALSSLPLADTSRIGIFGWSRGGMMTYLTLKESCKFKAAVVGGGLSDLFLMKESRPVMEEVYEELIPEYNTHKDSLLTIRSAIKWPEKICKATPVLMLHGTADWRVVPNMALDLAKSFLEVRQPFRLIMLEGGDHGLNEFDDEVFTETKKWFDYYVRDRNSLPNLIPHGR